MGGDDGRLFDVAAFLRLIHPDTSGHVFEIRAIDCPDRVGGAWKRTVSGFFTDHAKAASEVARIERLKPPAIYVTANPIDPTLLARAANRIDNAGKGATSNDTNVVKRTTLFIDIDPRRASGISSTDAELAGAQACSDGIAEYLSGYGWGILASGMSGNGCYLIYRIDLPNDSDSLTLISRFYSALKSKFDSDTVEVDESNKNAGRIMKVLGTWARKGDELKGIAGMEDRPHRRSWYIPGSQPVTVTREQITEVCDLLLGKGDNSGKCGLAENGEDWGEFNNEPWLDDSEQSSDFSIDQWIADHRLPLSGPEDWPGHPGGRRWKWTEAPPLCDHPLDAAPFFTQLASGAISCGCRHNHCTWDWKELRRHYEPNCYERREHTGQGALTSSGVPLYVAGGGGGANASQRQENHSGRKPGPVAKTSQRDRIKQENIAKLTELVGRWKVQVVTGEPASMRFIGEEFALAGEFFECSCEVASAFGSFQRALIPIQYQLEVDFAEAWPYVFRELVMTAERIEGGSWRHITKMVAGQIFALITERARIHVDSRLNKSVNDDPQYYGITYRETERGPGFEEFFIDFPRLCEEFKRLPDFEPKHLRMCAEICGIGYAAIHGSNPNGKRVGHRWRMVDREGLVRLGEYGEIGNAEYLTGKLDNPRGKIKVFNIDESSVDSSANGDGYVEEGFV